MYSFIAVRENIEQCYPCFYIIIHREVLKSSGEGFCHLLLCLHTADHVLGVTFWGFTLNI